MKFDARPWLILILVVGFILLGALLGDMLIPKGEATANEQPVIPIALAGPVADGGAEVSGWRGMATRLSSSRSIRTSRKIITATVFICPLQNRDPRVPRFAEPRAADSAPDPLNDAPLRGMIEHYQGFEAIAFSGDRVFLSIEAGDGNDMRGYLVAGRIQPDLGAVTLDVDRLVENPLQMERGNKSDEALLVVGDRLLTFYEVNGAGLNPHPVARVFNLDLYLVGTISFPNVEYRVTDAAPGADAADFWVVNYFFPGDVDLKPALDLLFQKYGLGPTHSRNETVERLVEMRYSPGGITLADTPPVLLKLLPVVSRNWEGLALLDERGFLLMTDKFPETIFGFVPMP
jgi:hypothetical protein